MAQYQCPDCGYIYDETVGCEREGYAAGTKWDDVPEDFPCPDCFVREKPDFEEVIPGE
jgi:rubredoxin